MDEKVRNATETASDQVVAELEPLLDTDDPNGPDIDDDMLVHLFGRMSRATVDGLKNQHVPVDDKDVS